MKEIILSIVIPTKNRYAYAIKSINSLLRFCDESVEIVVVDNSDDDNLELWATQNLSQNINYRRIKGYMSVCDNFQMGLDIANGEYICCIGDDDSVNPEILPLVYWAQSKDIDAVTPKFIADYKWPDLNNGNNIKTDCDGILTVKKFSGKKVMQDVEKGMRQLAKTCGTDLADAYYIPKIYYGIIKRKIILEVKSIVGTNFPGISPDLSGAVTASNFVDSYLVLDYPIFIAGSSIASTAGQSAKKRHHGNLSEQTHIARNAIDNWPIKIPKFFSVETVWSQSAYVSLKAINRHDLVNLFNFARLYACTLMFNISYAKYVYLTLRNYSLLRRSIFIPLIFMEYINYIKIRAKYFIANKKNKLFCSVTTIKNIKDVDEASKVLSSHLKSLGFTIEKCLDVRL